MDTTTMLLELSRQTGTPGQEGDAVSYAQKLLDTYGETALTPLGSLICTVRPATPGGPHILLDAHIDQVGMVVTFIEEDGFLRVANCGGIDRRVLPASPVVIHGAKGKLCGVVASTPPHLSSGEGKTKPVDELCVDVGLRGEEAKKAVRPGDRVTLYSHARPLLGGQVSGSAMDDRAGCVAILKALEYLEGYRPECGLSVLLSTMEEVGGQGARTAAFALRPTLAIAVDVSFAHTPDAPRAKCGVLGDGPMVGVAPILSSRLSRKLGEIAESEDIPCQWEVMAGATSTNADSIAVAGEGVEAGLLSVPLKYMHTAIETVSLADVENTGKLIAAAIRWLGRKGA